MVVSSSQVLSIKLLSCGGLRDLMSEMEVSFLVSSLPLFRNVEGIGLGKPRANVNLARAYTEPDFYKSVFGDDQLLHLIAHANGSDLEVGWAGKKVSAVDFAAKALKLGKAMPSIIVSTGCGLQGKPWQAAFKNAGAKILIAAPQVVTPANLTAFDMSFYSALLAQTRKGTGLVDRVVASFELADRHYRAIHPPGTRFAKFELQHL
jgi:hypothetical protein